MDDLDRRLQELLDARKEMTLVEFIEDVEKRHFRTASDTGANHNALFIWNMVREKAGLSKLTEDDLIRRHAESVGREFEDMKRDYWLLEVAEVYSKQGHTWKDCFELADHWVATCEANNLPWGHRPTYL